jgi:hypothetical protein
MIVQYFLILFSIRSLWIDDNNKTSINAPINMRFNVFALAYKYTNFKLYRRYDCMRHYYHI